MADAYALIKVLVRSGFAGHLHLVVNLADNPLQGQNVHLRMARVVHRFLDTQLHYAGTLLRDEHMVAAVRARRTAVTAYPRSPTAAAIQAMALRLGQSPVLKTETQPFLRKVVNWLC
jgi:flagellar biosynthesis protein FlhG